MPLAPAIKGECSIIERHLLVSRHTMKTADLRHAFLDFTSRKGIELPLSCASQRPNTFIYQRRDEPV